MITARVDLSNQQIEHLKTLVTGQVSTNETILDQHGRDESAIPPVRPSAVVMPQSTEEVSKVLAYCNKEGIPVVRRLWLNMNFQEVRRRHPRGCRSSNCRIRSASRRSGGFPTIIND